MHSLLCVNSLNRVTYISTIKGEKNYEDFRNRVNSLNRVTYIST